MSTLKPLVISVLDRFGVLGRSDEGDVIKYKCGDDKSKGITTVVTFPRSDGEIIMYSGVSFKIPEKNRQKTAAYLNEKNFECKVGCLEIDLRDGEVRFRTSLRHGEVGNVENIICAMVELHHTFFACEVYPTLKELSSEVEIDDDIVDFLRNDENFASH